MIQGRAAPACPRRAHNRFCFVSYTAERCGGPRRAVSSASCCHCCARNRVPTPRTAPPAFTMLLRRERPLSPRLFRRFPLQWGTFYRWLGALDISDHEKFNLGESDGVVVTEMSSRVPSNFSYPGTYQVVASPLGRTRFNSVNVIRDRFRMNSLLL